MLRNVPKARRLCKAIGREPSTVLCFVPRHIMNEATVLFKRRYSSRATGCIALRGVGPLLQIPRLCIQIPRLCSAGPTDCCGHLCKWQGPLRASEDNPPLYPPAAKQSPGSPPPTTFCIPGLSLELPHAFVKDGTDPPQDVQMGSAVTRLHPLSSVWISSCLTPEMAVHTWAL